MRDPFAKRRSRTFVYADTCVIPRAVPLQKPDGSVESTFDLRDEYGLTPEDIDGITLTLRIPNRKGDQSALAEITQTHTVLTEEGPSFRGNVKSAERDAFMLVAEAWAWDREITPEAFDDLELWAAEWVQACVGVVLREGRGQVDEKKGTTPSPTTSPDSSDAEASSIPTD